MWEESTERRVCCVCASSCVCVCHAFLFWKRVLIIAVSLSSGLYVYIHTTGIHYCLVIGSQRYKMLWIWFCYFNSSYPIMSELLIDGSMLPFRCHYGSSEYRAGDLVSLIIQSDIDPEAEILVYVQVWKTNKSIFRADSFSNRRLGISSSTLSGWQKRMILTKCL